MTRLLLACSLVLAFCGAAWAHSWYPSNCCGARDCTVAERVVKQPNGDWVVYFRAPWFDTIPVVVPKDFPKQPSMDGNYHICPYTDGSGKYLARCVFEPGNS